MAKRTVAWRPGFSTVQLAAGVALVVGLWFTFGHGVALIVAGAGVLAISGGLEHWRTRSADDEDGD